MPKITRQEQKENTRRGLVEHATQLFARFGISAITTADVAKAAEVSHGTIFLHYPTREELVRAVVEQFGDRLSAELGRRLNNEMSLADLLKAHLGVLGEFEDFYLRLVAESHSLPPAIRGLVYAMNASLSYRFYGAAQRLMKEGSIKKYSQVEFFTVWMSILHYQIMNRDLFCDQTPILKHKREEILRLFFSLIKKEPQ